MNEFKRFLMRASSSVRWKSRYGISQAREFAGMRLLDMTFEAVSEYQRNACRRRSTLCGRWLVRNATIRSVYRMAFDGNFLWYADGI